MGNEEVRLIEPREDMQEQLIAYSDEFRAAGEPFWQHDREKLRDDFAGYIRRRRDYAAGRSLPKGHVPGTDYWLVRGRRVLGTIRLRHRLNEALKIEGGHIGYDVRPSERRKGYATRMLGMVLDKAREMGLNRVLVTCDADNLASARVVQKNGGRPASEGISPESGKEIQRYWIDL